ncbi:hypothetical protein [Kitasatospora purpeofusca]|uniref:hypothetical protein n=1 Tax=Kitasatospora purpeofusca TaxID=67352 RepID=UPI00225909B9|nr:hypothetical protein [Kitasatospora purpeofusca]MCX4752884.1 hypothetical protein [Kitasatospora purpeofusca]WSR32428.1 hypothetical protein OG715_16430 [Kitasatospora purpeofusca]
MKDSTRRTIRTTLQTALGIAAALPLIVSASGIPEATPGIGVGLAVAAGLTKVMALPAVDRLLPRWLRAAPDPDGEVMRRAVRE